MKFPIEWAIRELYDNFEIFRKKIFNGEEFSKIEGAVREISTDFQSENGFELTKDRRIKFWAIGAGSCKSLTTSLPTIRWYMWNLNKIKNINFQINLSFTTAILNFVMLNLETTTVQGMRIACYNLL